MKRRAMHKEAIFHNRLRRYGISSDFFGDLWQEQNGCCAICGTRLKDKFYIDHNHKTGQIRGLLCSSCNVGIGLLKDSPDMLSKAIKYLSGE